MPDISVFTVEHQHIYKLLLFFLCSSCSVTPVQGVIWNPHLTVYVVLQMSLNLFIFFLLSLFLHILYVLFHTKFVIVLCPFPFITPLLINSIIFFQLSVSSILNVYTLRIFHFVPSTIIFVLSFRWISSFLFH